VVCQIWIHSLLSGYPALLSHSKRAKLKNQTQAYLYAGSAVLMWATVASAFKLALRELDFIQLLFFSTLFSTLALTIVVLAQRKWRLFLDQSRGDILKSALLGLLNPFAYYLVLFKAYSLLPAQEAQPLNYTWPIVLSLMSVPILGQKLKAGTFLGLLVSLVGVIVIATRGDLLALHFADPLGTALALLSTLLWATYWILNLKDSRDPAVKLAFSFAFGLIYITVLALCSGHPTQPSPFSLATTVYVGLFEMGLTFFVWLKALNLSRDSASVAGLIYLSPFLSLLLIHYVVGEEIYLSSVIGLALIVGGILIQRLRRR